MARCHSYVEGGEARLLVPLSLSLPARSVQLASEDVAVRHLSNGTAQILGRCAQWQLLSRDSPSVTMDAVVHCALRRLADRCRVSLIAILFMSINRHVLPL